MFELSILQSYQIHDNTLHTHQSQMTAKGHSIMSIEQWGGVGEF